MNWQKVWLDSSLVSEKDKKIINQLTKEKQQESFSSLPTITNSWRASIGLGSNKLNRYNIQLLAKALLVNFLYPFNKKLSQLTVLICHDNRQLSLEASQAMADVFLSYQINVFFFVKNQPVPTPFLSYLLKNSSNHYQLGVMITASHNQANINGCKFMYSNGTTFTHQDCQKLQQYIKKNYQSFFASSSFSSLHHQAKEINLQNKNDYLNNLLASFKLHQFFQNYQIKNFSSSPWGKIYYSPLNGMGQGWTDQLLNKAGFEICLIDKHYQKKWEDCQFKNVIHHTPNPENDHNFWKAFQTVRKKKFLPGDLIILNDGDSDRMRVACRLTSKKFHIFSGNEIAIIFFHFLLVNQKQEGDIYRSQVSAVWIDQMLTQLPNNRSTIYKTNTGFNHLAEKYSKSKNFLFAFEESIGYLIDNEINHDKDGLQAALLIANINKFLAFKDLNLKTYLEQIYQKFGYFWSWTKKIHLPWQKTFPNFNYEEFTSPSGKKIYFFSRFSQTEPLVKFYFQVLGKIDNSCRNIIKEIVESQEKQILELFFPNQPTIKNFPTPQPDLTSELPPVNHTAIKQLNFNKKDQEKGKKLSF